MHPNVSVLVPTFNGATLVQRAVASVFRQSVPPRELIAIDDGSNDETVQVLNVLRSEAPFPMRVLVRQVNSGGPACPLNLGAEQATGSILAFLDQDDWYLPDALERMASSWEQNPGVKVVAGMPRPHGALTPRQSVKIQSMRLLRRRLHQLHARGRGWAIVPGHLALALMRNVGNFVDSFSGFQCRRDDWLKRGGLDEGLSVCADMDLLACLCRQGDIALTRHPTFTRSYHGTNHSNHDKIGWEEARMVHGRYHTPPARWQGMDRMLVLECMLRRLSTANWRGLLRHGLKSSFV